MSFALAISSTVVTMSTREIADLVGKQHSNIKISAERLAEKGVIGTLAAQEFTHNGNKYVEYLLNKRDSLVLVAQNCPEFTARLVDRWQELESKAAKPAIPDFSDPVAAARAWADAKEAELKAIAQLEQAKPAVQFVEKFVDASTGSKGVREVAKLLNANEREFVAFLISKQIMYRLGGRLTPYAPHLDAGRFEVKAGVADNEHAYTTSKFTAKGIQWIAGLWVASQIGEQA